MALKLYISVAKELKLKVRTFSWLIATFIDFRGEKLVGDFFVPSLILNMVNGPIYEPYQHLKC